MPVTMPTKATTRMETNMISAAPSGLLGCSHRTIAMPISNPPRTASRGSFMEANAASNSTCMIAEIKLE